MSCIPAASLTTLRAVPTAPTHVFGSASTFLGVIAVAVTAVAVAVVVATYDDDESASVRGRAVLPCRSSVRSVGR